MADEGFKRKLTAILSADVVGYSHLMEDNEDATIQTLNNYRNSMSTLIQQHRGRVVDTIGDNLLAEFTSAVDAVNCAVEIQRDLAERNAKLPSQRKMEFRIGVNVGDVVEEEGQIYGDGVNIAARVESMAEAGGICISGRVYDQVENKLEWQYDYLGEKKVKNISRPIRVYKLLIKSERSFDVASEERMALPLPDKPSIAVLPFDNMSGDPSQEYFSDGLTEQIINGLCKVNNLFVIARNSSFAYKGKSISIRQIAQELGVKYILEGSVQKAGNRLRITAQLIDATTDYHMWSESYDRDLSDIFALQDEITLKLMEIMEINLTFGEQARLWAGGTTNIQAYDRLMRGSDCIFRNNEKDNKQARQFFNESISIDSTYAMAYVYLGYTHMFDLLYGWSKSIIESFEQAEMNVEKALALNDSLDVTHSLLGCIYLLKRQHDKAIVEGERAIELNPNGAEAHTLFAFILCWSDNVDLAIKLLKRAYRLNPFPLPYYYIIIAMAYRIGGQYEKAIEWAEKGLSINPDQLTPYLTLAASYSSLNHSEKARNAVEEALRIDPNFSLEYFANMLPYKNQEDADKYVEDLRKAGLPE